MEQIRFRVDHPGHILACHGLRKLVGHVVGEPAEAVFDGDRFSVRSAGAAVDLHEVIGWLAAATIEPVATAKPRDKAAPLLVILQQVVSPLRLDWWTAKNLRPFKMWSGRQASFVLASNLQSVLRGLPADVEPFDYYAVPLGGRFGFDPAAGRTTGDVGFSPDRVGLKILTAPAVELLALIGLQFHQFSRVGPKVWQYVIGGQSRRFGLNLRGQCKALDWAEEEAFDGTV